MPLARKIVIKVTVLLNFFTFSWPVQTLQPNELQVHYQLVSWSVKSQVKLLHFLMKVVTDITTLRTNFNYKLNRGLLKRALI